MEFTQESVDKIRNSLPFNGRKEIAKKTKLPYTTVCDALKVYRDGGRKRYKNRKSKIYNAAVELLEEKGVDVEKLLQ